MKKKTSAAPEPHATDENPIKHQLGGARYQTLLAQAAALGIDVMLASNESPRFKISLKLLSNERESYHLPTILPLRHLNA